MEQLNKNKAINKDHPNITTQGSEVTPRISFRNDRIYFNASSCKLFGIVPGKYIHFFEGTTVWKIIIDNDSVGFMVNKAGASNKGLSITALSMLMLFRKNTRYKTPSNTFYLVESKTVEFDGRPVMEFDISKSIEELLKNK